MISEHCHCCNKPTKVYKVIFLKSGRFVLGNCCTKSMMDFIPMPKIPKSIIFIRKYNDNKPINGKILSITQLEKMHSQTGRIYYENINPWHK